ncbi:MAG TPA: polyketide cyclase [Actinomycetales bacterium]|nr:polyketide cyclase [Actinomycetales bacterium]
MPTDSAQRTVEIAAPLDTVLATIRDLESQPVWVPEILEAEVLEVWEDSGLPATARFRAAATVGTDAYVLTYEHREDGMDWSMVSGRLQKGQEGEYRLTEAGPGSTTVAFRLAIHHNLPLPGMLRRRVITGLVDNTVTGLKKHLES